MFWLLHRKRKDKRENRRRIILFLRAVLDFFEHLNSVWESAWSLSFKSGIQALEVGLTARVFYGLMIDSSSGWMRKTAPFEEEHRAHNGFKSFLKYRSYCFIVFSHKIFFISFFFKVRFYKRLISCSLKHKMSQHLSFITFYIVELSMV